MSQDYNLVFFCSCSGRRHQDVGVASSFDTQIGTSFWACFVYTHIYVCMYVCMYMQYCFLTCDRMPRIVQKHTSFATGDLHTKPRPKNALRHLTGPSGFAIHWIQRTFLSESIRLARTQVASLAYRDIAIEMSLSNLLYVAVQRVGLQEKR